MSCESLSLDGFLVHFGRNDWDTGSFHEGLGVCLGTGKVCLDFPLVLLSIQIECGSENCRLGKPTGCLLAPERAQTGRSIFGCLPPPLDSSFQVVGGMGTGLSCHEASDRGRLAKESVQAVLETPI